MLDGMASEKSGCGFVERLHLLHLCIETPLIQQMLLCVYISLFSRPPLILASVFITYLTFSLYLVLF